MTAFSPLDAALEGLRVVRREPKAVLGWLVVWLVALIIVALVTLVTATEVGPPPPTAPGRMSGAVGLVRRFGPLWPFSVTTLLVLWAMTTTTAYRAVLRPAEHGWHLFRLSMDEVRIVVVSAAGFLAVLFLGAVPAFLVFVLVSPLMAAVPAFARDLATIGAVLTVCLDVWLAVRLSLIAVETFAERRFHLTAYWPLTRGRFWNLLASYAVWVLLFFTTLLLFGVAGFALGAVQSAVGVPHGADPLRRGALLGLAAVLAIMTASFFVMSITLFCACQAYAYRAIVDQEERNPGAA
jgi:hypothetical protein